MESSEYSQLLIDLSFCNFGGLILSISDNSEIPDYIIANLQLDMPERFQLVLQITDYKTLFPIFFSKAFESLGSQPVIFHVVGLTRMTEFMLDKLILNLQNNRELFKKGAYILVFWITKEVEKKIFYLAPDFFQWTLSSYDFSNLSKDKFSSTEKNYLLELKILYISHIKEYLKRVVWQYENWQCVLEGGDQFIINSMGQADLGKEFVKLFGKTENGEKKNMDFFVQEFIENSQASFLTLLGDFGTGKTSFALRLFVRSSKQFIDNDRNRIPIFVNLKKYSGTFDFREFIQKECFLQFGIPISIPIFQLLACEGAFLFILDGFDEFASVVEDNDTIVKFRELTKLTFDNVNFLLSNDLLSCSFNKVFLTCRTHYFFTENQEINILTKDNAILYRDIVTKKKFHVARIHLALFAQDQIRTLLKMRLNNADQEKHIFNLIRTTYNLFELANRPLLLKMISESIPFIKDFERVNASSLYQTYINLCIERDGRNSKISATEKLEWIWSLALKLFFEMKGQGVLVEELSEEISRHFNDTSLFGIICYETTTKSFLVRNIDGKYNFAHKSFLEYFIAEYEFLVILNKKIRKINRKYFNEEIFYFLGGFIEISKNKNFSGCDFSDIKLDGLNLINLNLSYCKFSSFLLGDVVLDSCDLTGAKFESGSCIDVIFKESNCSRCTFSDVKFRNVRFLNADVFGIKFLACNFENQNFMGFSFNDLDISGSIFKGAKLRECSFQKSLGLKSNFENADLEGVSFIFSNFSYADFRHANLKGADFGWATLVGTNASYCDMTSANLGAVRADGIRFNNAKLVGANLEAGKFGYSMFVGTDLAFARFSNETQITGSNFLGSTLTGTSIQNKVDTSNKPDWLRFYLHE